MDENADHPQPSFEPCPPRQKKNFRRRSVCPAMIRLLLIFLVGILLGNLLWQFTADVLAFHREDNSVQITVFETDTLKDISKKLKTQGLVDFAWLFRLYARITNAAAKIKPGTYVLHTRYDYHALVKALSAGKVQRSTSFFDTNQGVIEIQWLNWSY